MNACMAAPINVPPCAPHTVIVENLPRNRRGAISEDRVTRLGTTAAAHSPVSTRQIVNWVGLAENAEQAENSAVPVRHKSSILRRPLRSASGATKTALNSIAAGGGGGAGGGAARRAGGGADGAGRGH